MATFSNEELYGPCPCGSGKKLKFCCKDKGRVAEQARVYPDDEVRAWYELGPADDDLQELAIRHQHAGRVKEALKLHRELHARHPDNPVTALNVLVSRRALHQIDEHDAVQELRTIVARAPRYLFARRMLAALLEQHGKFAEAEALLDERHLVDAPTDDVAAAVRMTLARLALRADREADAMKHALAAEALIGAAALNERDGGVAALARAAAERAFAQRDEQSARVARAMRTVDRVVEVTASTASWFAHFTVDDIKEAFEFLDPDRRLPKRKAELLALLVETIETPAIVLETIRDVIAPSALLDRLVHSGGRLSWSRVLLDDDVVARQDLDLLLASGLAVAVTIAGAPVLALPPAVFLAVVAGRVDVDADSPTWSIVARLIPAEAGRGPCVVAFVVDVDAGLIVEELTHDTSSIELAASIALTRALSHGARPDHVVVESAAVSSVVSAALPDADVVVGDCSAADDVIIARFDELGERIALNEASTWSARGVDDEQARRFHEIAADLYRARPWDVIPDDGCALIFTSSDGLLAGHAAIVIGHLRQHYGVVLQASRAAWRQAHEAAIAVAVERLPARVSLTFERGADMPAVLFDEVKKRRFAIAGPAAVPLLEAHGAGAVAAVVSIEQGQQMALAMQVIAAVVAGHASAIQAWRHREPLPLTVSVVGADGAAVAVAVTFATYIS